MTNQNQYNVAVVGATGAVGQQILNLLEKRDFPINRLKCLASARSAGKTVTFKGETMTMEEAKPESFENVDIALFSAGGSVSEKLASEATARGAVVIDNTSAFRMDPDTPLVVPEINPEQISAKPGIIANPNCSTIQMVVALKPLLDNYGLDRIIVSTYQAVSGAGNEAVDETMRQSRAVLEDANVEPDILPVGSLPKKHQIAFNAIPQIDVFMDNDYSKEEMKMVNETKKIYNDSSLPVSATCVRLPVETGHSESVYVELKKEFDIEDIRSMLDEAPGVRVIDQPQEQAYPLAVDAAGKDDVFVGRLRRDLDVAKGLHMWVVADNLLKGAALNAVQIAERVVRS